MQISQTKVINDHKWSIDIHSNILDKRGKTLLGRWFPFGSLSFFLYTWVTSAYFNNVGNVPVHIDQHIRVVKGLHSTIAPSLRRLEGMLLFPVPLRPLLRALSFWRTSSAINTVILYVQYFILWQVSLDVKTILVKVWIWILQSWLILSGSLILYVYRCKIFIKLLTYLPDPLKRQYKTGVASL